MVRHPHSGVREGLGFLFYFLGGIIHVAFKKCPTDMYRFLRALNDQAKTLSDFLLAGSPSKVGYNPQQRGVSSEISSGSIFALYKTARIE